MKRRILSICRQTITKSREDGNVFDILPICETKFHNKERKLTINFCIL